MPRLSLLQFVALILFAPLAMTACDIPYPSDSDSSTTTAEPDLTGATLVNGELTDGDGARETGQKRDIITTVTIPPGATFQAMMESDAFDTYLFVEVVGSDQTFSNDDFNGSQRRSYISRPNPTGEDLQARIIASSYGSASRGAYTVRYLVSAAPKAPDARTLSIPTRVNGTISTGTPETPLTSSDAPRRADAYAFTLRAGQTATVRMESSAFDTYLKVLRDGTFSTRNDDFGGSRDVSQVSLSQPGTYTVLAGSFSTSGAGNYTLAVTLDGASRDVTDGAGGDLLDGDYLDGDIFDGTITDDDDEVPLTANDDIRKADGYDIELLVGETLVVEMSSASFDTYLKLVQGDTFLIRNDDAGSTHESAIRYTATRDGTFTVYAGTFTENGRGDYVLSWRIE